MILYSVTMGDGAVLAPDSFLMKGEEIPAARAVGWQPGPGDAEHHPADFLTAWATPPAARQTTATAGRLVGAGRHRPTDE